MSAMRSWLLAVVAVLALVVALHHLGVDAVGELGSALQGAEQVLGHPLVMF